MGKIVDFDKAKKESNTKKEQNNKVKRTNEKLLTKMKRRDHGKTIRPIHFYVAVLLVITVIVLISQIQL